MPLRDMKSSKYGKTPTHNHPKDTTFFREFQIKRVTICHEAPIYGFFIKYELLLRNPHFVYNCEHPIHMTMCQVIRLENSLREKKGSTRTHT